MPKITAGDIKHIANLARIKLTDREKEKMASELGSVLDYMEKLNEVDVSGVEPETTPHHKLANVLRKDGPPSHATADHTEKLLKEAPDTNEGFIKVPSVLEKNRT